MRYQLHNIRFYTLVSSLIFSLGIFLFITNTISSPILQIIRLTQLYALTSVVFLYFTLLAGPLCYTFMNLPFRGHYLKARRALGVSSFYFGLLHALLAFFGQLGGFEGLGFLTGKYLFAITLSFIALLILFLQTLTSFDAMVAKLTYRRWKMLHRLVYVAGISVLIHALMLGTHFSNLSEAIPQLFLIGLIFLLLLEALRIDVFLEKWVNPLPRFGIMFVLVTVISSVILSQFLFPNSSTVSLGIHAQHIKLAQEANQPTNSLSSANSALTSAMTGDKTKRFTVDIDQPVSMSANQDISLTFHVYDASSGTKVTNFKMVNEKLMHLIIVDDTLKYFSHVHPEYKEGVFSIVTKLPYDGMYHFYMDFQPQGAIEQQIAFTLPVGEIQSQQATQTPDANRIKTFGEYAVSLKTQGDLQARLMSIGKQKITFTLTDATSKPVTTLKPYLGSYGHLVMINQKTYEYMHVHPNVVAVANKDGGPTVEFLPIGIYGPFKPGIYRVFAQFNPDDRLFVADFTVQVN